MMLYLATITVLAVSAFANTVTEYTEYSCPQYHDLYWDWNTYEEERVCLMVVEDRLATFHEARNYCQNYYGDLVSVVKSKEQKDFVQRFLTKGKFYWIGLHIPDPKGNFMYVDGTPLGRWDAFMRGEPNFHNNNEYCVEMKNGKWNDKRCSKRRNFVCQTHFKALRDRD